VSKTISQSLLPEFDHEMANARRTLERVPEELAGWKPHEKSMSMGQLAYHVAGLPLWITRSLTASEFDLRPEASGGQMTTRAALLEQFDTAVADARRHLADADDALLMQPWTFKKNGQALFSQPKLMVVRTFALNHLIHHRGQLSVYLRLNGVPVPGLYGPSADEM
jgi:uncharacterized damage-inducible protein DinB